MPISIPLRYLIKVFSYRLRFKSAFREVVKLLQNGQISAAGEYGEVQKILTDALKVHTFGPVAVERLLKKGYFIKIGCKTFHYLAAVYATK